MIPVEDKKLDSSFDDEPYEVYKTKVTEKFAVGLPIFNIGFKSKGFKGRELVIMETAAALIMQMLFSNISPLYKDLLENGLINSNFSYEVFDVDGVFACICSGESKEPDKVLEKCIETVKDAKANGLDEETFEMLKKSKYGSIIRDLNNVDNCASLMMLSSFAGEDAFCFTEELAKLTIDDCMQALDVLFDTDNISISIVDNK